MITTSKLVLIAAVASLTTASAAFAQSYDPEAGSGNIVSANVAPAAPQRATISARQSGLHAFAMVPRAAATDSATAPQSTGGGSSGYNEMLLKY